MLTVKRLVIPEGKISDYIDGKFRNDTPEEYVRQTIEKRLINEHKYAFKQIKIEYTLQLGSNKPRADIVIFDKECTEFTQNNVKLIIECKKETVDARSAKDGIAQLKSYMSACPNVLITRYTYGSVVDEIDDNHVRQIPIPLLKDKGIQKRINDLALEANQKRYEAYCLEQEALKIMDEEVIYAK